MKWRLSLGVAALLLASPLEGQQRSNYRQLWLGTPESERTLYVLGFQEGLYTGGLFGAYLTGTLERPRELDWSELELSLHTQYVISKLRDEWVKQYDPGPFGIGVVAEVMTTLYEDPANSFIPMGFLFPVAIKRLQGVAGEEVERDLEVLRKAFARESGQ